MKKQYVHEVLDAVAAEKGKAKKIAILKENDSGALRDILRGTYDAKIVWLLPEGPPPFRPGKPESAPSNFMTACVKLKYLVKGAGYDDMLPVKRESIYIGLLEGIHPRDATMVIDAVSKTPITGVTKALVKEAFPNLIME